MDNSPQEDIIYHLQKINEILPKATSTTFGLVKTIMLLLFILVIISLVAASYSLYDKQDKSKIYKIGIYTGTGISGLIVLLVLIYLIYYYNSFDNYLTPIRDSINYISQDLKRINDITRETIKKTTQGLQITNMSKQAFQALNRISKNSQYFGTKNIQNESFESD